MKNIRKRVYSTVIAGVVAASIGAFAVTAQAAYETSSSGGFYASGYLGASKTLNETFSDGEAPASVTEYGLKSEFGFAAEAAFGWRCQDMRAELAVGYTENDSDTLTATAAGSAVSVDNATDGGDGKATTVMLNGYYDFNNETGFVPYVGLGIGFVHLSHDFSIAGTPAYQIDDSENELLGQAIVGVGCDITPNLRVMAEYRFQIAANSKFDFEDITTPTTTTGLKGRYESHRLYAGLTYFM